MVINFYAYVQFSGHLYMGRIVRSSLR